MYNRFIVYVFVSLTLAAVIESGECPDEFEDVCECGFVAYGPHEMLTFVTNCTNTGFDNTMMLRKMPPETEVLIFVGNEIKDLPLNIFGLDIVYENLHTIDLSNNHIQTIKGRTFHNVANVTRLLLNDNDLYIVFKDLHTRMFSNFVHLEELHLRNAFTVRVTPEDSLKNLEEIFENSTLNHLRVLHMEDNGISTIDPEEFCSLPALEELYLGSNNLKDIPMISCLKNLNHFDISNNMIHRFSDESLHSLAQIQNDSLLMINLTDNPFSCDCNMLETYMWFMNTDVMLVNREEFYCDSGFHPLIGRKVFSLHESDFDCNPDLPEYYYSYTSVYIIVAIGLCVVLISVAVVAYKHRQTIAKIWRSRIIDPIRSKIYYVSLQNLDTMEV